MERAEHQVQQEANGEFQDPVAPAAPTDSRPAQLATEVEEDRSRRLPSIHPAVDPLHRFAAKFIDIMVLQFMPCVIGTIVSNVVGFDADKLGVMLIACGYAVIVLMDFLPRGTVGKRMGGLILEHRGGAVGLRRRVLWVIVKNLEWAFVLLRFAGPAPLAHGAMTLGFLTIVSKMISLMVSPMTHGQMWYDRLCGVRLVWKDQWIAAPMTQDRGFEVIPVARLARDEAGDVKV